MGLLEAYLIGAAITGIGTYVRNLSSEPPAAEHCLRAGLAWPLTTYRWLAGLGKKRIT